MNYFLPEIRLLSSLFVLFFLSGCYEQQRDCQAYKTGKFEFSQELNGYKAVSIFERFKNFEVETFNQETDTSMLRWINNCEYVLQHKNPRSRAEKKSVHIKILSTTDSTYTFEYGMLGEPKKFKGTAKRIVE